ncbi:MULTISPECIES: acyltransferase family protein [unclassified Rhodococcus (in: high G+C Gram-positive bacteria)]|uniref:acyltransferase family protein n=1 Tax=unclassified Rhodococcus (in: high G+C Gram-positive bacteria) TaxID=192944 RepID=UPI0004834A3A|nr:MULTISPECIES: acyltransferase [unclassified Rhodococcus (in: high G+C Gram-positive bacteria)]MBY6678730.1 acyltransferase [Rhodococcus sp. BP-332]
MTDTPAPVTAPPTQRKAWIAGLEGPRGVAAICVVLAHVAVVHTPNIVASTRIDFLGQALTFFFALSGFLLYLPYVTRFADGAAFPNTKRYFVARVRRVFPAYIVIFLIVNFVLGAGYVVNPVTSGWDHSADGTGTITAPLPLLAHLTLTQSYFPSTLQTGINPSWSLSTEWGFYLVLPIAGFLLFRFGRGGRRPLVTALIPAVALIALGLIANTIVGRLQHASGLPPLEQYWGPNWVAVFSRSFLALADHFAWGMVAAVVYAAIARGAFSRLSTSRLSAVLLSIAVLALSGSMLLFALGSRYISSVFAIASCASILAIVAPLGRGEDSRLARMTDWAPLKYLGMVSLSSYLWHYPVLVLVGRAGIPIPPTALGLVWGFVLVMSLTVALGSLTYYLVERPMMRWRAGRTT